MIFAKPANQAQRGPYVKAATTPICRLRLSLRLTQPEAAKRAGVGLRTFQRAEVGDPVARSTRARIERSLGLSW